MERTPAKNTHLRYDEDGSAVSAAQFFHMDSESNNVTSDLAGIATNLDRTHLGSQSRFENPNPNQLESLMDSWPFRDFTFIWDRGYRLRAPHPIIDISVCTVFRRCTIADTTLLSPVTV